MPQFDPIDAAAGQLRHVRTVTFDATSAAGTGWVGVGQGTVAVEPGDDGTFVSRERGTWTPAIGRPLAFANAYRWTPHAGRLHLAHLRFGDDRPVELFDLVAVGPATLRSARPHACGEDGYAAELTWADDGTVRLIWTITGPAKAERIEYAYR